MTRTRAVLLSLCLPVLAGCEVSPEGELVPARGFLSDFASPGSSGGASALAQPDGGARLIEAAPLADGEIIVAGPPGYCIDPETVESGRRGGFAMLASCNILSGGKTGPEVTPAIITVSVGPEEETPVQPSVETLAELSGASVLEARSDEATTFVYLEEGGQELLPGGSPGYWRGAFLQGARLVGLAVYAPADSGLTRDAGAELLSITAERIRRASPRREIPVSASGSATPPG
ncbi:MULTISPECIES: dihydroxy-acid dehydratase [unclassified Roseivivax]|uniref:dihydroxy-acid dehydratase n=1 Tax=Roseivivax sp. GX 12232 TaxID=2900547 RepID=UPI001E2B0191|nr:dihydroxy-acid dehydratase [Roseivivax sp. GX 12232]MCE0506950.1 dihydroxy-acid dehydratase [Roseivivax sp. GX 12232]